MGDCAADPENTNKKRLRDHSPEFESSSPAFKRVNSNAYTPPESHPVQTESNQPELEGEFDSPQATMIRQDLLDILDDTEAVPAIQDLDSVIRSFEEEILQVSAQPPAVELTSDSGDSQPDLGYLLEASDDELGLPPTATSGELPAQNGPINTSVGNGEVLVGLDNMAGFEDDLQSYDTFGLGLGERASDGDNYPGAGDFVTVDGLFDYSEPSDFSDFAWRPESLPAL